MNKLPHAITLGCLLAITSSLHATVLFSDGFDSYTNGTGDANYTAAYGGISGGPTCVVTNGTGLSGSKSVQAPGTTDMTLIRKNVAIDLTSGTITNSIYFQRVSAQIAAPQIGLMSELSGALNTVNSVGGRLNQFDQLDVRSSEGGTQSSVGTAVSVGTLTNGNWYNIRTIITKTATTNQLTIVLQLWNSDTNGVAGTLIAANTQTATNASVWADTTLYAAIRLNNGNSGVSNLDNFSATQLSVLPTITLTGTLGAVNTTYGTASASPTSFQISGSNLTGAPGNLTVTPPSGYEVSRTNNSGYSTSLSVPYSSSTLASTNVYVRLTATTAVGTYSGNITVSGGGATVQTIVTAASTVSPVAGPPVVNSFTLMYPGTGGPVPGYDPITNNATINLSLTGTNLSIRANTSPSNDFGSVAFNLTGATTQSKIDNTYPWSLSGDSGGSYTGLVFNVGANTLTATPYPADGGGGSAGTAATINFTNINPAVGYPPLGYQLVWADEFNGNSLDTTKWGYENPGKWRDGYNTPNAVSETNGLLTITTYTENGTNFTCELNTYNKFTPKFGYVEASIDFNDSPGEWSGFWMYDYSVPVVGNPKTNGVESDIIEHLAHNTSDADVSNQGVSTLHWDGYGASHRSVTSGSYSSGFATGFHTCALLWTPDSYKFIMDGVVVWTTTNAPAQDPTPPASPVSQTNQFLLFSSEVWNSNWVGTITSGGFGSLATSTTKLKVDYVRYYQLFPDTNPPAVLILTPTNGASQFANLPVQISATVTDNVAVAFAQLYLDGTNLPPTVSNVPYYFTATNLSLGAHTIKVVGQDTTGNRATNSVNVTLVAPTPPAISLVANVGGLQLSWGAPGFNLQQSALCTGPWTNIVPTPASPFLISPTNLATYFRLLWTAP